MRRFIDRVFFDHPGSVDESYGEHFIFAAGFGLTLLGAGAAALVHAVIPCFFERTASTAVKRLYPIVAKRGAPSQMSSTRGADEPLAYI